MSKTNLPSLNGLRAISIIMVIFNHIQINSNMVYTSLGNNPITAFITDGQIGVNFFFIISGFLITYILLEEEKRNSKINLPYFFIRRILRIFPAYYGLLLFLFLLQIAGQIQINPSSWISSLTFTKYFNWKIDGFTAHLWSLSVEEQFYLLWPFIFILGEKKRKWISLSLLAIIPLVRILIYVKNLPYLDDHSFPARLDSLLLGCLCAMYWETILVKIRPAFKIWFILSIIFLVFIKYLPMVYMKYHIHLGIFYVAIGESYGTLANMAMAIILFYSIFETQGIWFKLLNSKIMNTLGILSYSIYLWQQIFTTHTENWYGKFPINIIGILVFSFASYNLIEKPFIRLKGKFNKIGKTPLTEAKWNKPLGILSNVQ